MRVGDLVEYQHGARGGDILDVERGQGIGLDQQPLMHGVGRKPRRDRLRPHDLGRDGQGEALAGETVRGIFRGENLADGAARIGKRGRNGVPAVEDRDALLELRADGLRLRREAGLILRPILGAAAGVRLARIPFSFGHAA